MIKHSEAAVDVARDRTKTWKQKLQEILLEIGIIIFAVSVSIGLHNWADSRKDRREEREFLAGLKTDLLADMEEMKNDRAGYENNLHGIRYFEAVGRGAPFSKDSLAKFQQVIFGYIQINPRISRFEALKGSGRLDIIRNKELLIDITDLYQKDFAQIVLVNNFFNNNRNATLTPYIASHLQLDSSGKGVNWPDMLRSSQMRIYVFQGEGAASCILAYSKAIEKCQLVIRQIDKELN